MDLTRFLEFAGFLQIFYVIIQQLTSEDLPNISRKNWNLNFGSIKAKAEVKWDEIPCPPSLNLKP
jgi:hypothetical protein